MYKQGSLRNPLLEINEGCPFIVHGVVDPGEPASLWGALPVVARNSRALNLGPIGAVVSLATNVSEVCGFTVFDQGDAMYVPAGSTVPQAGPGMAINFVRLGSGAQLVVKADEALVQALKGQSSATPVTWDFDAQQLVACSSSTTPLPIKAVVAAIELAEAAIELEDGCLRWVQHAACLIAL